MLSIIIPVYNEESLLEKSVSTVCDFINLRNLAYEIIIVSNGSTDQTAEIGKELERSGKCRFFELPQRGPGRAFVEGVREAKGDYIISLDVDLSSELRFIDYAHDLLKYADMVVGSKTMGKQRRSPLRILGSQLYILLTLIFFDLTISDYSIGAKAYRRESILAALPNLDTWTGYVFELCLFLHKQKKHIIQVGIECDDRRSSRFNLLHEGVYRFYHLYRSRRQLKEDGWIMGMR